MRDAPTEGRLLSVDMRQSERVEIVDIRVKAVHIIAGL